MRVVRDHEAIHVDNDAHFRRIYESAFQQMLRSLRLSE
jgi:hypothetical protein